MCISYYHKQPKCDCTYATGTVETCALFKSLPKNRNRVSFRPKLVTSHCRDLNILFNGVDYVSVDVENDEEVVPNGLECEDLRLCRESKPPGLCPLCDEAEVVRFLTLKGVEFLFPGVADEVTRDAQKEEGEGVAEGAGGKAAGKSGEGSVGESADEVVGTSSGKEGPVATANRAQEMVEGKRRRPGVERRRSGLAESTSASMGWD